MNRKPLANAIHWTLHGQPLPIGVLPQHMHVHILQWWFDI